MYINDPKSMPIPTIIDASSLFEFNHIISRIFIVIHHQLTLNGSSDTGIQRIDDGPLDFILNRKYPFVTKRWTVRYDQLLTRYESDNMERQKFTTGEQRRHTRTFISLSFPIDYKTY